MTQAHVHLVITHLPIFGSLLGAFVLGYGIWSKSNQTKIAAYWLFIISAVGTGIAYLTGEGAEEGVEDMQGVAENLIKQHEEFAMFALVGLTLLGISSLVALYATYKNLAFLKTACFATFFISFISFALVARTGYLGGQIRHTEISTNPIQKTGGQEKTEKADDD
jgi:uncharacterized membrane protein